MSTEKEIPLNVELIDKFFFSSLKLNGHPFFKTSFRLSPSILIIDRE